MKKLCLFLSVLCLQACHEEVSENRSQSIGLDITDDQEAKVDGAEILVDGKIVDADFSEDGVRVISLSRLEQSSFRLQVRCPDSDMTRDRYVDLERYDENMVPVLKFYCPKTSVNLAVVVYTGFSGIDVHLDGVHVGTTDELGSAHLSFFSRPEQLHHLRLDVQEEKKLRPSTIEHSLQSPRHDGLLVVEQSYEKKRKKRKKTTKAPTGPIKFKRL